MENWTIDDAKKLYGIESWGNGFFDLNEKGEVVVSLRDGEKTVNVSLPQIVAELGERGRDFPLILRFRDLLDRRIESLNESFRKAIATLNYKGNYRGVYPIKVNQQQQVIEEITAFGKKYHYGLEAGSKPELIAALAYMQDKDALLICNGYKDEEFIDLALNATRMGLQVVLVVEMPSELPEIIRRSRELGIRPTLGLRFRLSTKSEGHWAESGGDRSVFGLNTSQVIDAVDHLRDEGFLDCLKLFHYHQGSQLPNIRAIREAATEAVRVYVHLVREGAPMGLLDMGGGLAIDYDGSHRNDASSCNYDLEEYASDLVEIVQQHCQEAQVPHPDIVTESGRAVVAYYSVLVFNILDVTRFESEESPDAPAKDAPEMLHSLWEVDQRLNSKNLQECFNDALFYRDQIRSLFTHGLVTLRQRAEGEKMYWHLVTRIAHLVREMPNAPDALRDISDALTDVYYANFSVFQSIPDSWAIGQLFPVMPIHQLDQKPDRRAILADITCDCDGKIDRFIDPQEGIRRHLPVHNRQPGDPYHIGVFLVGAYQETLGDLHNLLGDPNVVSIGVENGELTFTHEVEGDSVADVLSYVEYDPKDLENRYRLFAEQAVKEGRITATDRKKILEAYREGLHGYTYYEG